MSVSVSHEYWPVIITRLLFVVHNDNIKKERNEKRMHLSLCCCATEQNVENSVLAD